MLVAVGDRQEAPARAQHAADLGETPVEVGHVVEHPHRRDQVEGVVREGQVLDVGEPGVDAAGRGELHEARRLVGGDHGGCRGCRRSSARRRRRCRSRPRARPAGRTRARPRRRPRPGPGRRRSAATPSGGSRGWSSVAYCAADGARSVMIVVGHGWVMSSRSRASSSCCSVSSPRSTKPMRDHGLADGGAVGQGLLGDLGGVLVADVLVERGDHRGRRRGVGPHPLGVGGDAVDAALGQQGGGGGQQADGLQQVAGDDREHRR